MNTVLGSALIVTLGVGLALAGCSNTDAGGAGNGDGEAHFGTVLSTPAEYQEKVLDSGRPALVDFYADWCPPCKLLAPVLAQLETEYAGRIDFYRVDVDAAKALATAHGVTSIPTLHLANDGHVHETVTGFEPADALRKRLDALLAGH